MSEKFFALVERSARQNVGMMTGDSAVNADAPIICCTAEILANIALRTGDGTAGAGTSTTRRRARRLGQVVMDEFHFYADPQRGWAWQVPLLELPRRAVRADVGHAGRHRRGFAEDLAASHRRATSPR